MMYLPTDNVFWMQLMHYLMVLVGANFIFYGSAWFAVLARKLFTQQEIKAQLQDLTSIIVTVFVLVFSY